VRHVRVKARGSAGKSKFPKVRIRAHKLATAMRHDDFLRKVEDAPPIAPLEPGLH
jgi:hypothetical protein